MIRFIEPYFTEEENTILFKQNQALAGRQIESVIEETKELILSMDTKAGTNNKIAVYFGSMARKLLKVVVDYETFVRKKRPIVAIPTVVCGSVYEAVKDARVTLMDCDESWNSVPTLGQATDADILLYAHLGGKKIEIPPKTHPDQVIIDDACQRVDPDRLLSRHADYGLLSFGMGKPIYAGEGGVLIVRNGSEEFNNFFDASNCPSLPPWKFLLMLSQLKKIREINSIRRANALAILDRLSSIDRSMIVTPDPKDHFFSKLMVRLPHKHIGWNIVKRTPHIAMFIRHMRLLGIGVEETYVPLHVRFPQDFGKVKCPTADLMWPEMITLPARPGLSEQNIDRISKAVALFFEKQHGEKPVLHRDKEKIDAYNQKIYNTKYAGKSSMLVPERGYFRSLYDMKTRLVRSYANGTMLDAGCGNGNFLVQLLNHGLDVYGVDYADKLIEKCIARHGEAGISEDEMRHRTFMGDICDMRMFDDGFFSLVFSFSTLPYMENVTQALREFYRILRPGGILIAELGNKNSLADIEAARVTTSVRCYHTDIEVTGKFLHDIGFSLVNRSAFQVFPMYGGMDQFTHNLVVPAVSDAMDRMVNGVIFDEIVSSSPFIEQYAFRHVFVMQKTVEGQRRQFEWKPLFQKNIAKWVTEVQNRTRVAAFSMLQSKKLIQGLNMLFENLDRVPHDAVTVYSIMKWHLGKQEDELAEQFRMHLDEAMKEAK